MICLYLILVLIKLLTAQKCDMDICNNEGECVLKNGEPTCNCFGYFKGQFCNEPVNKCNPNPCKGGATCIDAIGQYVCDSCPAGFGGQDCSFNEPNLFIGWHVLFNHRTQHGQEVTFLHTVKSLGSTTFVLEFFTKKYMIDVFEMDFDNSASISRWQKSDNLEKVAQSMGLSHASKLPYTNGYYHVSKGRFWDEGLQNIELNVYDSTATKMYTKLIYPLFVVPPVECTPQVDFPHGTNPREPLFLDIARWNIFEPVVRKRCFENSARTFSWWVYNTLETVKLHSFGTTSRPLLKVHPYRMWFNFSGEVMQSYTIILETKENFGTKTANTISRCYTFVMPKPVSAVISGGKTREVNNEHSFTIDGGTSRDFALSPEVKQDMTFQWSCASTDEPSNLFCNANIGTGKSLIVPAEVLTLGKSYHFTLKVTSLVNIFSNDEETQVINVVADKPLATSIECVRNCAGKIYAPGKPIHLKAICKVCSLDDATISWSPSGHSEANKERVVYDQGTGAIFKVELIVSTQNQQGKASIELKMNEPPKGGKCKISPTSGVEYETEFLIQCIGFSDNEPPISYQYIAVDEFTVDRTTDPRTQVRLPKTSSVEIVICDSFESCTEQVLSVSVSDMTVPTSPETLHQLWVDGDVKRAITLANALSRLEPSLEACDLVFKQIQDFPVKTLLVVEQLIKITKNLLKPLKPLDNKKAVLFTKYFEKIAQGFREIIQDTEVKEFILEPYQAATKQIGELLTAFSEKTENIPPVQSLRKRPAKGSVPFEFDKTALPRITNWLRAARAFDECIRFIGVAATNMLKPTEKPLLVEINGLKMEVHSFERREPRIIKSQDESIIVSMSSQTISNLQSKLKSDEVLLQVAYPPKDPYWWFPDDRSIATGIIYFSAFSWKSKWNQHSTVEPPLHIELKINRKPETSPEPLKYTSYAALEMAIFYIPISENSLLLIKISEPSTDLRVLLKTNSKPRGYQLRRSGFIIGSQSNETILLVMNSSPIIFTAYIAVMSTGATQANFDFTAEERQCVSWNFNLPDPEWTTSGCIPATNVYSPEVLECSCNHLTVFAGRVSPATVDNVESYLLLEYIPINWYMILFYAFLALFFILMLLKAYCDQRRYKESLITETTDKNKSDKYHINVEIASGSYRHAGTTSNLFIQIGTNKGTREFIMYQDPANPHLKRSSICFLKLPLRTKSLLDPLKIVMWLDRNGRYPTWYCKSIKIVDAKDKKYFYFKVERWICNKVELTVRSNNSHKETKKYIFKSTLEKLHINWFQFQSLLGPWRYYDMNRFDRTCICVSKICLTVCILACYFGTTTLGTYEEERERYGHLSFNCGELFLLCLICYVAGLLLQLVLTILYNSLKKDKESLADKSTFK